MSTIYDGAPLPIGATEADEWPDVGGPDEFRTFTGPTRTIPGLHTWDGSRGLVLVCGTQLADGTVEERYIKVLGVAWDDELTSQTA
jgi:hypothetical protein